MLLAGDIGGTKTLLALYDPNGDVRKPVAEAEFHSADYAGLDVIAREFLAGQHATAAEACFDVAGPVLGGRAHLTNLPWVLEETHLRDALGLKRVTLLNDLRAIAVSVPHLLAPEMVVLNEGTPQPRATIAVVAPGTGLGEAFLVWCDGSYLACPSEGGHVGFAPTTEQQIALLRYLTQRFGHVSVERVCSGPGIAHIYDFLRDADPAAESAIFAETLASAHDRTPLISQAGLEHPSENKLASQSLAMFVDILASESADMVLKVLATGGLYLAGGIPAHILPLLTVERFLPAFTNKGRFAELLRRVPIRVVTTRAALLGAALHGLELIR
jgi:glucokinase